MMRAFLAFSALLAIGTGTPVLAQEPDQEPAKTNNAPADPDTEKSRERQEILNRQFREFESALLRLSQRLERSSKPEDRERAANLKKALELASKENTDTKFDRLVTILRSSKALNMREIEQAMEQSQLLEQDIRDILALLLADNRDAELKREKARLSALLKRIEKALHEEKIERAETEAGQKGKEGLAKEQKRLANDTADIAKDMGKNAQSEGSKSKGQGGGKGKGEGEGKGGGKGSGNGGGSGSEGEPKEGSPKQGESPDNPQQQDTPGRKHVQDANEYQRQAEQNIRQDKKNEASSNQGKSIEELEKARKKLEELLRQLREEEMERMLAALQARCERMLAMQIAIYESTKRLNDTIQGHADKRAERIDEQKSLHLSDQEQGIVKDANAAIAVLEAEGSAVAFPEAFVQVRDDATHVARRLGKVDVGTVTQVIEQDIISTLKDMIEALKRKREANKSQGQGGGESQNALINLLAELKMIRAMQLRVNNRTVTYARQYDGEQAKDPDIRKELENLADREQKIFEALNDIARGKNK